MVIKSGVVMELDTRTLVAITCHAVTLPRKFGVKWSVYGPEELVSDTAKLGSEMLHYEED
jgi:hypothetical protein